MSKVKRSVEVEIDTEDGFAIDVSKLRLAVEDRLLETMVARVMSKNAELFDGYLEKAGLHLAEVMKPRIDRISKQLVADSKLWKKVENVLTEFLFGAMMKSDQMRELVNSLDCNKLVEEAFDKARAAVVEAIAKKLMEAVSK